MKIGEAEPRGGLQGGCVNVQNAPTMTQMKPTKCHRCHIGSKASNSGGREPDSIRVMFTPKHTC